MLFNAVHARGPGSLLQARPQPRELIACPHGQHFHTAVSIVAHPPGDSQQVRLPLHKPAESYTLDASPHQKTASLGIVCHGGLTIRKYQIAASAGTTSEQECVSGFPAPFSPLGRLSSRT